MLPTLTVHDEYISKVYDPECRWTYEEKEGGYPPVANDGRKDIAKYICPSTFRDMADYVYAWPYDRFGESQVYVPDKELALRNLPPVRNFWVSCH